jgi:hypothetical protein
MEEIAYINIAGEKSLPDMPLGFQVSDQASRFTSFFIWSSHD